MFNNKNEFYLQNEIQSTSKSENTIILGISHRDDEIKAIVNVILTTTKWIIWKERKMLQNTKKKDITKLKTINLSNSEISFLSSLVESTTRKDMGHYKKKWRNFKLQINQ
jgi:hypothetical protein